MSFYEQTQALLENRQRISISNVLLALAVGFIVSRVVKYRRGLQAVSDLPGLRKPFFPFGLPGAAIPTTWWNPGLSFTWFWRDNVYKEFGYDTISYIPYIIGPPTLFTSNVDVVRQVAGGSKERSFCKPEWSTSIFGIWGMNLASANGDVWRRHRRVTGPAFNNDLYKLVWSETVKTYREMVDAEGFADKNEIVVPQVQSLTFKLALLIIGRCGFGFNFTWSDPATTPDGSMSVQEALHIVVDTSMLDIAVPKTLRRISPIKRWRESVEAKERLLAFMQAQVAERKNDINTGKFETASRSNLDVFSMLVKASEAETAKHKLNDDELIGNTFVMLFAGHETTAQALAATIGFMAYHPDLQKEVYEQIISGVGHERNPDFEDYNSLDKVLGAFLEALRIFPSGYALIREAYEDTVLQIPKPHSSKDSDETITIPIPKGTMVIADMIGVQYNPRYFDKPTEYIPSRWTGISVESEAFSAFSLGPRTCIGRKFATTEAVSFLTMLLRDFHIEPLLAKGETKEQWKERVLDGKVFMTLAVKDIPVKFVSRRKASRDTCRT